MSNRRVKSLAYGDDDFEDYEDAAYDEEEEGDGLTDEDRQQLATGTQKVRGVLGDGVVVSDKEIQESLWHYYYDVDKTVNYILNRQAAAQAKAAKQSLTKQSQDTKASQSKQNKGSDASKSNGKQEEMVKVSDGVGSLTISETPRVKSKNLDVLAEYKKAQKKRALNFVVIGHVDAGKSTLMGRLLLDLGVVDQRILAKYQKEADQIGRGSFALAWVMDQEDEERERGVTMDIAQTIFETDKTTFTILDAPGHRDFVPNMIAGVSQADFAVLVIDASTDAFESGMKGQTREHALLARSNGVTRLVVAVNKLDNQSWSKARFEEIVDQLGTFLTTTGFQLKNVAFVPCSGLSGDNVTKRTSAPESSWYNGPILLDALESSEPISRPLDGPLRLPIADVFRGSVQHPISISGRIDSGSLQTGDQLVVVPAGETANIRAIEVDSAPADWAVAGQNVVLHLGHIDEQHLRGGDVLCGADKQLKVLRRFAVKVLAFDHILPMTLDVHRGRLHVAARVAKLVGTLDKNTSKIARKSPQVIKPGELARLHVVIEDDEPGLPLERAMRVVLRSGGETVAAGLVEKDLDDN